jgi:hypothetical protein
LAQWAEPLLKLEAARQALLPSLEAPVKVPQLALAVQPARLRDANARLSPPLLFPSFLVPLEPRLLLLLQPNP